MRGTREIHPRKPSSGTGRAAARPAPASAQPRSRAERYAAGKALRAACPRESHAGWQPPAGRRDAVELVLAAEQGRVPDLLSLRHGRMVRSAFTFYRGAALTMAADLASYAGASVFANQGQRVVHGYRLMRPASDVFLGWSQVRTRHFFFRQLRDMKLSLPEETFGAAEMDLYAGWCGKALALSHARSGNSALITGYMGKSDAFDEALASFSSSYADQNEQDHAALERAVRRGKVKAVFEEGR